MFSLRNSDLRRIKEEDLELILAWRNSGHVRTNMFNSQIISWQEHIAWFDKLKQRMDQTVLIYSYKDTPLGVVNFTKIDRKNGRCDWGFYIGCTQAPSGSGTAMGLLGLDYAFYQNEIKTVFGQCFVANIASSRYHEKLGFVYQGLRQPLLGNDLEVKFYQLTAEAWEERRRILYPAIFEDYQMEK